jgi:hypothetical protein
VAGAPYDTLEEVIGLRGSPNHGSLKEFGVSYRELPVRTHFWTAVLQSLIICSICCLMIKKIVYMSIGFLDAMYMNSPTTADLWGFHSSAIVATGGWWA